MSKEDIHDTSQGERIALRPETSLTPATESSPEKSYRHQRWNHVREETGGQTVGLIAGVIGALVSAVIVGSLTGGIAAGVAAALVTFLAAFSVILLVYYAKAPQALDSKRQEEIDGLNTKIRELNSNKEELTGKIATLEIARKEDAKIIQAEVNNNANTYTYLDSVESQLKELKKQNSHKLKLKVDTKFASHVFVAYYDPKIEHAEVKPLSRDRYIITAYIHVQFSNEDIHPNTVNEMQVRLIRKNENEAETEISNLDISVEASVIVMETNIAQPIQLHEMQILSGRITAPYILLSTIEIPTELGATLDHDCFLRVTMDAMRQPTCSLDFDVDWETERRNGSNSYTYITPRK
jgi:hypothetical protein